MLLNQLKTTGILRFFNASPDTHCVASMSPSCAPSACVDEPNLTTKSDLTGLSGRPCETITELPSIWCDYFEPNKGKAPMEACCMCGGRYHIFVAPSLLPLQNPSPPHPRRGYHVAAQLCECICFWMQNTCRTHLRTFRQWVCICCIAYFPIDFGNITPVKMTFACMHACSSVPLSS